MTSCDGTWFESYVDESDKFPCRSDSSSSAWTRSGCFTSSWVDPEDFMHELDSSMDEPDGFESNDSNKLLACDVTTAGGELIFEDETEL